MGGIGVSHQLMKFINQDDDFFGFVLKLVIYT